MGEIYICASVLTCRELFEKIIKPHLCLMASYFVDDHDIIHRIERDEREIIERTF